MKEAQRAGDLLQEYAERGVFRSFSRYGGRGRSAEFHLLWHRDQLFQWVWDGVKQTLRVSCVLPAVPAKSSMYRDFKAWLKAR